MVGHVPLFEQGFVDEDMGGLDARAMRSFGVMDLKLKRDRGPAKPFDSDFNRARLSGAEHGVIFGRDGFERDSPFVVSKPVFPFEAILDQSELPGAFGQAKVIGKKHDSGGIAVIEVHEHFHL